MSPGCCNTKGQCSDAAPTPQVHSEEVDCCGQDDASSCCNYDSASSCRDGKEGSCDSEQELCDEKCIVAAAAEECAKTCNDEKGKDGTSHTHEHNPNGNHPASACTTHLNKAFEQYKAYLDTARCICRSVLERGLPSTHCSERYKSTAPKEGPSGAHAHKAKKPHHHHHVPGLTRRRRKQPGHVHAHGHDHKHDYKHNHNHNEIQKVKNDGSSCCSGHDHIADPAFEKMPKTIVMRDREERDLEKAAGLEQISLVVDGMTCSGCGNKMERTLKAMPGV